MKTLKISIFVFALILPFFALSQVGIGTVTPNAQFEIKSTNQATPSNTDGILIPKIDEFSSTNPTALQDGMMVYVTGSGTPSKGYYYWDNSTNSWVVFSGVKDHDFYKIGTTTQATSINDDVFTQGRMAIGGSTISNANTVLQTSKSGTTFLQIRSTDGSPIALNFDSNNNGQNFAMMKSSSGSTKTFSFTRANSSFNGWQNDLVLDENGNITMAAAGNINNKIGLGMQMIGFSEPNKVTIKGYGNTAATNALVIKNLIEEDKFTFRNDGKLKIGPTGFDYLFPNQRGNNSQLLQADTNGRLTWVDASSLGTDDQNISGSGLSGTTLTIGIEGGTDETVDLSSLAAKNTLDESYDEGGAGAGRTITATDGAVTIAGEDGFLVTGTYLSGDTGPSGAGTKMFFNPRKAAFRAGLVDGTQWDDPSLGNYSIAMGYDTTASGVGSTSFGNSTIASGNYSTAMGAFANATGEHSTAIGRSAIASGDWSAAIAFFSNASGDYSIALGKNSYALGDISLVMGHFNYSYSFNETTIGAFCNSYTPNSTSSWNAADRLFVIGNGTSVVNRSNALTIYKNGLMNINDEYNMPLTDGTTNQLIQTDGSGNLSWVDSSSLDDGDWTTVGADIERQSGDVYIGNTANTNNNLYISASIYDWDTPSYYLNPGNLNIMNEIQFDNGSVNDPKIRFTETNSGFYSPGADITSYTANGTEAVRFEANGSVKILTAIDAGGTAGTGTLEIGGGLRLDNNEIITNTNTTLYIQHNNTGDLWIDNGTFMVDASTNRLGILNTAPSTDVHLKQSDNLQAGGGGVTFESALAAINWKIYHSGSAISFAENGVRRAYISASTGAYVQTSDRTLKKSISMVEDNVLSKLSEFNVYRYHYLDQNPSEEKTLGVMAQEIKPFFPELVNIGEDGNLGMNYAGLSVVAIQAIKEQQKEIENQRKEIDELKKLVQQLLDKK